MKLNRVELKKTLYDFNSISNRLMRVHFDEYKPVLAKFLDFLASTEIIKDFVVDCGSPSFDIASECQQVARSYGREIFSLGGTNQHEIANIYGILMYLHTSDMSITALGRAYSTSNKYQDGIKEFNERVLMVLIRHIEGYLTKIGIDMGMDEKIRYAITVNNGQVNLASDNAVINATQNNGLNATELSQLLEEARMQAEALSNADDKQSAVESIEVIESEARASNPKKSMIKTALMTLQAIKGTSEFTAPIVTLAQFVQSIL